MRSKYSLMYEQRELLQRKSKEFRKHQAYSMWNFDTETGTLYIYTTQPGYWIGRIGVEVEALKNELNEISNKANQHLINAYNSGRIDYLPVRFPEVTEIKFEECDS